jgi:hypothetical protein
MFLSFQSNHLVYGVSGHLIILFQLHMLHSIYEIRIMECNELV